jgi:hypothetical protein
MPLDAARISTFPRDPMAGRPEKKRPGAVHDIYDYAAPTCEGAMLAVSRQNRAAWTFTCYRSCAAPADAGLGKMRFLVKDETAAGVNTSFYVIEEGSLKGVVATFTPLEEKKGGNEINLQTVAAIQADHEHFIADWLCAHRNAVPGIDSTKCSR